MRQIITISIIPLFLWSCNNKTNNKVDLKTQESDSSFAEIEWNYREVRQSYVDSLMLDICSTQDAEFIDLYPFLDSIASDKDEKLVLVDSLKSIGFKVTEWGRGNWMKGPRIVNVTMTNQQCECQIDKLYYSINQDGKYKVTERIKCKKASK